MGEWATVVFPRERSVPSRFIVVCVADTEIIAITPELIRASNSRPIGRLLETTMTRPAGRKPRWVFEYEVVADGDVACEVVLTGYRAGDRVDEQITHPFTVGDVRGLRVIIEVVAPVDGSTLSVEEKEGLVVEGNLGEGHSVLSVVLGTVPGKVFQTTEAWLALFPPLDSGTYTLVATNSAGHVATPEYEVP